MQLIHFTLNCVSPKALFSLVCFHPNGAGKVLLLSGQPRTNSNAPVTPLFYLCLFLPRLSLFINLHLSFFPHIQYWWLWLFHPYIRQTHPHSSTVCMRPVKCKDSRAVSVAIIQSDKLCSCLCVWDDENGLVEENPLLHDAATWFCPWEQANETESKWIL